MTFENETSQLAALKILLCGGIAGIVTWASIFPLDMVKTRLQAQTMHDHPFTQTANENQSLLRHPRVTLNSLEITREVYRASGMGAFYRGLGICSVRAFIVNAVQVELFLDTFSHSSGTLFKTNVCTVGGLRMADEELQQCQYTCASWGSCIDVYRNRRREQPSNEYRPRTRLWLDLTVY